jgi:hypothetical protein
MATKTRRILVRAQPKTSNKWKWTGFSGKTLWDWLRLFSTLAIPIVVLSATLVFTNQQDNANKAQHDNDIRIAVDQQEEATLKTYLDDMTTLLLDKKLGSQSPADKAASDEANIIARAKTLIVLRRLTNSQRKARVVQFLYEARLIGYALPARFSIILVQHKSIIDLSGADLSGVDLNGALLEGALLDDANLSGANLRNANLDGADLDGDHLNGADLSGASLTFARLGSADLSGAHLHSAYLDFADLDSAHLSGADLRDADLVVTNLQGAIYSTKTIQDHDPQGNPLTLEPTLWPQGFDPKVAGAKCDDC